MITYRKVTWRKVAWRKVTGAAASLAMLGVTWLAGAPAARQGPASETPHVAPPPMTGEPMAFIAEGR